MLFVWTMLLGCPRPPPAELPALQSSPLQASQASTWYLRARLAEARGDVAEAERSLQWVIRLDRGSPWAWMALARFRLRQAHLQEAEAALEEAAARADEPLPELQLLRARVLLASGRGEAALSEALSLLDDPVLGRTAAEVAVAAGDRACQRTEVWEALVERADRPGWTGLVFELAHRVGDEELADKLAEGVALRDDDPALRARAWGVLGRPERAAVAWAQDGDAGRAGDAWLEAGLPERALQATANGDDPSVGWVRAGALLALGRLGDAEAALRATAVDAEDAAVRVARLRELRGDAPGALEALDAVSGRGADAARARLLSSVEPEVAEALWRAVVSEAPDRMDAWLGLAVHAVDEEAAGWVVDLASCDDVEALVAVAPILPPCEAAEALRRAVGARPADAELRATFDEVSRRCPPDAR